MNSFTEKTNMDCKQILHNYIQHNEGWHKKSFLYSVAEEFSPETVGRKLRDLEEEGKINVDYYKGVRCKKKLAMYSRLGEAPKKFEPNIIERDGRRIAIINI